jgi:hypothetical protein
MGLPTRKGENAMINPRSTAGTMTPARTADFISLPTLIAILALALAGARTTAFGASGGTPSVQTLLRNCATW